MDRAEPQQAVSGAPAPQPSHPGEPPTDGQVGEAEVRRALPAPGPRPEYPERPRGRHEAAPRRSLGGPAGAAIAVVIASVVFAGILATWLISSAKEAPRPPAAAAGEAPAATPRAGRPRGHPGRVVRQPHRQLELRAGPERLGDDRRGRRQPGAAGPDLGIVRGGAGRGSAPATVGLALPEAVPTVKRGQRYVASAWMRSTAPGQRVTLRLIGGDGREVSKATATTLPGVVWKRVIVDHTARASGPLKLEIVADDVPPGEALLVDEVVVRLG